MTLEYIKSEITLIPNNPARNLITTLLHCPFVEDFQDRIVEGERKITVQFNAPLVFYEGFVDGCIEKGVIIQSDLFPDI